MPRDLAGLRNRAPWRQRLDPQTLAADIVCVKISNLVVKPEKQDKQPAQTRQTRQKLKKKQKTKKKEDSKNKRRRIPSLTLSDFQSPGNYGLCNGKKQEGKAKYQRREEEKISNQRFFHCVRGCSEI